MGSTATLVTLLVAVLPVVSWVNGNAIWLPWAAIAALVFAGMLLIARVTAATEAAETAEKSIAVEVEKTRMAIDNTKTARAVAEAAGADAEEARATAKTAAEQAEAAKVAAGAAETDAAEARAALEDLQSAPLQLSKQDRDFARLLFEYASDGELLKMLGSFFPYKIPQRPVGLIDALSELPMTRVARDPDLERHFGELVRAAEVWRSKFLPVASTDGEYFSTKLDRPVSQAAYQQHSVLTTELGDAGFDLHKKLLAYQKYYASL